MGVLITDDVEVMTCPKCHGPLEFVSGTFPTGVRAPDGVQEKAYDEFYYCGNCVRGFSPEDLEDGNPQHDPDHWNPAEGGNRASDDYWN